MAPWLKSGGTGRGFAPADVRADAVCNPRCCRLDRIGLEMGVAGGGLDSVVTQQLADHLEALAEVECAGRKAVAEVMQAYVTRRCGDSGREPSARRARTRREEVEPRSRRGGPASRPYRTGAGFPHGIVFRCARRFPRRALGFADEKPSTSCANERFRLLPPPPRSWRCRSSASSSSPRTRVWPCRGRQRW